MNTKTFIVSTQKKAAVRNDSGLLNKLRVRAIASRLCMS